LEKRPLVFFFAKFCTESLRVDTNCRCSVQMPQNLSDGQSLKSCIIYRTTNFGTLSNFWRSYSQMRENRSFGP